jgi:hypothetical protein
MRLISAESLVQIQSPPPSGKYLSDVDFSHRGLIFITTGFGERVSRMDLRTFKSGELSTVSEALDVAEDKTGNFFKFSFGQWKRHRYDIRTLEALAPDDISAYALAVLKKGSRPRSVDWKNNEEDFYFICLQDHLIFGALDRDKKLELLPFLVYIFTHELVHVVRFCNFLQRYDISEVNKEREERVVHATTFEILKNLSLPKMDYVLGSYREHRICDMNLT